MAEYNIHITKLLHHSFKNFKFEKKLKFVLKILRT